MSSQLARKIVKGQDNKNERNVQSFVADIDGKSGVVADTIVEKNATSSGTMVGGNYVVCSGSGEEVRRLQETQERMNDGKILITVNFPEDLSPMFEQKFKPTNKIINVRSALKEERKKVYFLVREGKPGEILPDTLRVVDIKDDLYGFESEEKAMEK